jgi:hypothetical protein
MVVAATQNPMYGVRDAPLVSRILAQDSEGALAPRWRAFPLPHRGTCRDLVDHGVVSVTSHYLAGNARRTTFAANASRAASSGGRRSAMHQRLNSLDRIMTRGARRRDGPKRTTAIRSQSAKEWGKVSSSAR